MVELTYYDPWYNRLPFIHKSLGMLLILVFLAGLLWRFINSKPEAATGVSAVEHKLAKAMHWVFYLVIAIILASGYLIPTADGSAVSVFDIISVPATITSIPEQQDIAGVVHRYLSYLLIGLVAVHAGAALKHHFINRDNTLRRMLARSRNSTPD
jgi:cytochrome b561